MPNVAEIEKAIEQLTAEELKILRAWFAERDAAEWDRQLEADVQSGRLDTMVKEALEDDQNGRCTDL
jgi:hypothetical protein